MEIHDYSLRAHQYFDSTVWAARPDACLELDGTVVAPSYHNQSHVQSVVDCVRAVWKRSPSCGDPFDLGLHLERWRQTHGADDVTWAWLCFALEIAFSCHDLGNITSSARVDRGTDGAPRLDLGASYDTSALYDHPEVELRSAAIASDLLAHRLKAVGPREQVVALVHHLVCQTVFHFEKNSSDELFWLPMQTVDMIGSYFYSTRQRCEAVAGLFNEMRVQKVGGGAISLGRFLPSLGQRFELLLPDPGRRARVLALFEANPNGHDRDTVFAVPAALADDMEPAPMADAIRRLLRQ